MIATKEKNKELVGIAEWGKGELVHTLNPVWRDAYMSLASSATLLEFLIEGSVDSGNVEREATEEEMGAVRLAIARLNELGDFRPDDDDKSHDYKMNALYQLGDALISAGFAAEVE